ncbi:NmrA family transcriptional regulator [Tothia fuscella]|uniref:NmrA family transcriptional regulator n=1 Tax=Tothia fuscella TaxID=1048955 RepID=A0A9P4TZD1_9PEZI|nr:NmrA family transcriptional regulator [Tothia fuscella]
MVIVAIAGGTGGLGRTVQDAIAKSGQHDAIILSRTAGSTSSPNGFRRIALDYKDLNDIKHVLHENKVQVVVSCLVLVDDDSAQAQINLIRAAAQSATVDRFIPTEYYLDFHAPIPGSDLLANLQLEAEEELLRHPQLTFTLIRAGIFLDHLAMPYDPKPTYINPFWFFIDMESEKAVFPGDGSYPLVLTHSTDVAAYIDRLVGLPAAEWPRKSLIASNSLQVKDLEPLIQEVTGQSFQITWDSEDVIRDSRITQLPSNHAIFSDGTNGEFLRKVEQQIMLSMLSHAHDLPGKDLAELFPEVQPTKIEDFIRAGWELKQRDR